MLTLTLLYSIHSLPKLISLELVYTILREPPPLNPAPSIFLTGHSTTHSTPHKAVGIDQVSGVCPRGWSAGYIISVNIQMAGQWHWPKRWYPPTSQFPPTTTPYGVQPTSNTTSHSTFHSHTTFPTGIMAPFWPFLLSSQVLESPELPNTYVSLRKSPCIIEMTQDNVHTLLKFGRSTGLTKGEFKHLV